MMEKVMLDVGCSLEVTLAWCISTKHLCDSYGYSPNQLVFAYIQNFPPVIQKKWPTLERVTASKLIASQQSTLHSARKKFIENEEDEKLCRKLRHKRDYQLVTFFHSSDGVFFKRSDSGYWKEPGTDIEHDNKQVFVRHRGAYMHVWVLAIYN